jgi:hypothetical protein
MRLVLHPKVYSDIDRIMAYYDEVATPELANEFYAELRHFMREAAMRPESFAIREHAIRRVNLHRFLIISFFEWSVIPCEFSLSVITADIHL